MSMLMKRTLIGRAANSILHSLKRFDMQSVRHSAEPAEREHVPIQGGRSDILVNNAPTSAKSVCRRETVQELET